MSPNKSASRPRCTPEQVDEAAVWMTLLHASTRNEQTDRGFRRWLAANPAHAVAFEKISIAHEATAALPRGPFPRLSRWQRAGFREGFLRAAAAVAALLVVTALGTYFFWQHNGVTTNIGEQRMLALEDGTQVYLNTDTRIVVKYNEERRRIELKSGEALFEVAKDGPRRPFVVSAGESEITALGTSFLVRREAQRLSVTLMEGRVRVTPAQRPADDSRSHTLDPGQRLTFTPDRRAKLDRPALEKVIAWRSGHVDFDGVPLETAIAEMNRYSTVRLDLEQSQAGRIPITGIFRAGATRSFAVAVAEAYRLQILEQPGRLMLVGVPKPKISTPH